MNPLKSVGVRLSIGLLLVVVGALGIAYLVVVPRLENRLVDARFSQLTKDAATVRDDAIGRQDAYDQAYPLSPGGPDWAQVVGGLGRALNVNILMIRFVGRSPEVIGESWPPALARRPGPAVGRLTTTRQPVEVVVRRGGKRYGETAFPVYNAGAVMLVSLPLEDTYATIALVKRRLLYAGLIALAVALAVGAAAARMFARRIKRLERAADRIAAGHFDQPVVDTGQDELGQLALAFERMRQRLAHLEHARREFIANASHELRTPLFALAGLLELLDDEELDDETRGEFLTTAREQSDRLTKLATDLLDLSRLDAGRLHVEREPVALDELADVLADEFRAVAQAGGHPLEVLGLSVRATADEQRVLQIGRILLDNALLHTPPGTPVRIRTRAVDGQAALVIEDEGPGIPGDQLDHVFERFYRVNGTVTAGSGLGLAIARELAGLMRGTIHVESRPGRTSFTLALPPAAARAAAAVA